MSKFTEFADTFFFIARKKFAHVSMLQVCQFGDVPGGGGGGGEGHQRAISLKIVHLLRFND